MSRRKTILFIAESGSLAHVVRPLVLASSLGSDVHEPWFAVDRRYRHLLDPYPGVRFRELPGLPPEEFVRWADRGEFPFPPEEVKEQVAAELRLYDELRPDLVVSDFRHSAAISTSVAGIPGVALANVHWSPYRQLGFDPIAPMPSPTESGESDGHRQHPRRSATACVNAVRREYGLPDLSGYLDLVTRGDYTLYVEPEGFVGAADLPRTHAFIGPVLWGPTVSRPSWWERWDPTRPLVYVTLGSTGVAHRLPGILEAMARLPVTVVAATAGRVNISHVPRGSYVADYLPGIELSARAALVICNGGSGTAYQALRHGTPVLGIWSNIDQYLTMKIIEQHGAGRAMRRDVGSEGDIAAVALRLIEDEDCRANADRVGRLFRSHVAERRFRSFIDERFQCGPDSCARS